MCLSTGRILVATEAASVYSHFQHILEPRGFSLHRAADLAYALLLLRRTDYDAIVLDLADPMRGVAGCSKIRDLYPQLPLLLITAPDKPADKVEALDAGADDIFVRPIATEPIFIARLRSAIGRYRLRIPIRSERLVVGDLILDLARHCVQRSGCEFALTPKEFCVLRVLMEQAGRPIPHATLLETIWGPEFTQHREYLRVLIRGLRKKLERDPAQPVYLLTHTHLGYLVRGD